VLDQYLTAREYADHRRVSQAALAMERSRGLGPSYVKIGHRIRYSLAAVREFDRACRVVPVNAARTAR
jgi:hypothetical protein